MSEFEEREKLKTGCETSEFEIKKDPVEPQRAASPVFSCVSMKSNSSMIRPPYLSDGDAVSSKSGGDQVRCLSCQTSSYHQKQINNSPQPAHLQTVKEQHKTSMKNKYESLFEGVNLQQNQTLLNRIYTQLYIIEGESEGVNEEHEVLQMEKRYKVLRDTPINCNDIFNPSAEAGDKEKSTERKEQIKMVLTKGIAGIGKTVSVQKFILDWAEGEANQDIDFMFVLPFRELNLIKDHQYSLHRLLLDFHPELQHLDTQIYEECKVVFIFDGLDESRITLMFSDNKNVSDVTVALSVSVLISKLIKGDLLPSALIWITTRPAAANQIPSKYIHLVTEIQGFDDPQKEEYFRKKISDEDQASRIISHIRRTRSLHIMCHIPVFCWISAKVLQSLLKQDVKAEIPQTLTEMYIHFLLIQMHMSKQKYEERDPEKLNSNRDVTVKLAELAFNQLMMGNVMFYEEDLIESGIDVTDASVYSGICTEIFREESVIYHRKVYSFVHLSFQEFFAALYVFFCYLHKKIKVLKMFLTGKNRTQIEKVSLDVFLEEAMDKALESKTGHLDLFLRFLHGISLESNQSLLQGLLKYTENNPYSINKIIRNLKQGQKHNISPERWMNLSHCLIEMKDNSVIEEMQAFLKSKTTDKKLTLSQCSTLANLILMSEDALDVLDLKKYNIMSSKEGKWRLLPAVRNCRKALLASCNLTDDHFEIVSSALQSINSSLRELDLSYNDLQYSGVKLICAGLKSQNCQLKTLRLVGCNLIDQCCGDVSSALQSSNFSLRELDLSHNDLQDSGVKLICAGLKSQNCQLNTLRLSGCMVTEEGCAALSSALILNPSHLRELDLSYNHPGESGTKLLSDRNLQKLNLDHGGEKWITAGPQKYACKLTLDSNTANKHLVLSEENRKVTCVIERQSYPDHPERFEEKIQVLCKESLTGCCYWEAQWSNGVVISVSYKGIKRKGSSRDCSFLCNEKSWSLLCSEQSFSIWHNNKEIPISVPPDFSRTVGVFVDESNGLLSFYSISETHKLTHLHTFNNTFTDTLHAGFVIDYLGSWVSLRHI